MVVEQIVRDMAQMAERSAKQDHLGYYAALDVSVSASSDQIKRAFRQKALLVHPDRNQSEGAKASFQHLNEGYRVLMDAQARARYDAGADAPMLSLRGAQSASAAASPSANARGAAKSSSMEPITCSRCGGVTAQPRYVVFWRAFSYGFATRRSPVQGVFCRKCADGCGLRASALTWLFGWWGVPLGPIWTIAILRRNMLGGEQPPDVNAGLLRHQARYFMSIGNLALARAALDQGLRLVESPDLRARLRKLEVQIGSSGREKLVDRWRPMASFAFYLHLLPVAATLAGLLMVLAWHSGRW